MNIFLQKQTERLLHRRKSKIEILRSGGQQALSHSPHDIRKIDRALKRIEEGQYGLCLDCGSGIEFARLEIIPESTHCIVCARKIEQ